MIDCGQHCASCKIYTQVEDSVEPLTVAVEDSDQFTLITLAGRITAGETANAFRNKFKTILTKSPSTDVILNLEGVTYLDSCAIGQLFWAYTSLRAIHKRLRIVGPENKRIQEHFDQTQLRSHVQILASNDVAKESLGKTP